MTPSPSLVSAVLALPPEARRLLAQRPGAGWHVDPDCDFDPKDLDPEPPEVAAYLDHPVYKGCAWLPADAAEWMEAACSGEDAVWSIGRSRSNIAIHGVLCVANFEAPDAPSCALAALRARFPQEVTP